MKKMIKANRGMVELEGKENLLLAELSCVTRAFKEVLEKDYGEEAAKAMVMHAVEIAFLPDEELNVKVEKANELHEVLNELKISKNLIERVR